jgi:hypothetical protein
VWAASSKTSGWDCKGVPGMRWECGRQGVVSGQRTSAAAAVRPAMGLHELWEVDEIELELESPVKGRSGDWRRHGKHVSAFDGVRGRDVQRR